ncbi:GL25368 [Drosophila persimilis]|uniref:GL25368 n=1 Tax=Drosophila persimilis TaxID=7234 RepID=B4IRM1_DROPE|nr:GL25368 [Drosophila persimilis]
MACDDGDDIDGDDSDEDCNGIDEIDMSEFPPLSGPARASNGSQTHIDESIHMNSDDNGNGRDDDDTPICIVIL